MKILYGVPREGMGHATRSKSVIQHLIAQQHEVCIVSSDRAFIFLKKHIFLESTCIIACSIYQTIQNNVFFEFQSTVHESGDYFFSAVSTTQKRSFWVNDQKNFFKPPLF